MFDKTMELRIKDMEAIEFCKVLGKYGIKFDISDNADADRRPIYKTFTLRASKHKIREIYGEFSMMRDGQFNSYNDRESA